MGLTQTVAIGDGWLGGRLRERRAPSESGDLMAGPVPRVRLSSVGPPPLLVVRGDELRPEILRTDALRFFRRYRTWGRYGVSAFSAVDEPEVEAICETRLERFEMVVLYDRPDLERAGIEIVPTIRRPHVTLAHQSLDALVHGLRSCQHGTLANRYFDSGGRRM
jgi:hypothetical protein